MGLENEAVQHGRGSASSASFHGRKQKGSRLCKKAGAFIRFYRLFVTTKHLFVSITLKRRICKQPKEPASAAPLKAEATDMQRPLHPSAPSTRPKPQNTQQSCKEKLLMPRKISLRGGKRAKALAGAVSRASDLFKSPLAGAVINGGGGGNLPTGLGAKPTRGGGAGSSDRPESGPRPSSPPRLLPLARTEQANRRRLWETVEC